MTGRNENLIRMVRKNTLPFLELEIRREDGLPFDFSLASVDTIHILGKSTNIPGTYFSGEVLQREFKDNNKVLYLIYEWNQGDTDTASSYDVEVLITMTDGKMFTLPTRGPLKMIVRNTQQL